MPLYFAEAADALLQIIGLRPKGITIPDREHRPPLGLFDLCPLHKEGLTPKQAIARRVEWLNRVRSHVEDNGYDRWDSVLCGDFNVKVKSDGPPTGDSYSERDQDALEELLSGGYCDLYRVAHPNSIG